MTQDDGGTREQAAGKLPEAEAVYLIQRLVEEQVVTLDNLYERLDGRSADDLTRSERLNATATVAGSMMAVSLAVNHVSAQVDCVGPSITNAISTALYQYVQKVLMLLPSLDVKGFDVSFTASAPPAATLRLTLGQ